MPNAQTIAKFMGGKTLVGSPKSDFEFIKVIRTGLPPAVIASVAESSSFSEDEIYRILPIAKRTAARRKATGTRLKAFESELLYRLSCVFVTATETLGNAEHARFWLMESNRALNSERPIDLLDTGIGFEDVMDVLRRIEFGVYS